MKNTKIKVEGKDTLAGLRTFLGQLLQNGFTDALLVPKVLPGAEGFVQSLIKDPGMLDDANPFAPTMPVQSARILSQLTRAPLEGRIAVVLKPCELRAAVELVKFLQVDLENGVTIGVDCRGTYSVKEYAEMSADDRAVAARALMVGTDEGRLSAALREACRICEYPAPMNADIILGLFGCDASQQIAVIVGDRFEKELVDKLSLQLTKEEIAGRNEAIETLTSQRRKTRKEVLDALKLRVNGLDKLMDTFSTCIRCYNCMNVCPICYCKECVFQSRIFEHRPDQLLNLAKRKGAARMPSDTLIFHLTRLSHMATSCVGCGMCDSACPNGLPVSSLFGLIGERLQEMFDYVPGKEPAVEPPVAVFREGELEKSVEGG